MIEMNAVNITSIVFIVAVVVDNVCRNPPQNCIPTQATYEIGQSVQCCGSGGQQQNPCGGGSAVQYSYCRQSRQDVAPTWDPTQVTCSTQPPRESIFTCSN